MEDKKNKGVGFIGTIAFHAILIGLLLYFGFPAVVEQDEEGILVMLGEVETSYGTQMPMTPEPTPVFKEPVSPVVSEPVAAPKANEELVVQDQEESLQLAAAEKKKAQEEKDRVLKEAEKRRVAEQERIRKEQEAEKRRLEEEKNRKEESIRNQVANAFQGNQQSGQSGTNSSGSGSQGNPFGNSTQGATTGNPGYGSYDLGGRNIRGSLPKPRFGVNESGVVVVSITVNEDGKVINAILGRGTTTSSESLRSSAIEAARKAVFEVKSGVPSQTGSITYRFDSDN